ncbi:hypothetical protein DUNSADRAFT_15579 [Dunaliella salina]|uniref:Encoded protein n=1 Tax=Dunaliella salina TaxID=3046 RepID=A0ABQ7G547_DUNSA|nr:hypothetical protein DUNSADRAFT_15579 [Dunaliella salina]|eukprot:KAF5829732.1 hypothetical protein DUNSADRAFT_15579 [Dunaliella salina]
MQVQAASWVWAFFYRLLLFLLIWSSSILHNQVTGEDSYVLQQDGSSNKQSSPWEKLSTATNSGTAARTLLSPTTHNHARKDDHDVSLEGVQIMGTSTPNHYPAPLSSPTLEHGRRLQGDGSRTACFCHKFSAVGNLNDNCLRERLCFKQDVCGGSSYTVLKQFNYSEDCTNSNGE